MQVSLDAGDVLAIHQVLSLYGHLIDDRELSRLGEVFADDATFDLTDFGEGISRGLREIQELMRDREHPIAHHATNVVVSEDRDDMPLVVSKGLGVGARGRVGSIVYRDRFRRTAKGWRISERAAFLRRPDDIPAPS